MIKITRHEVQDGREIHWTEFYDIDGKRVRTEGDRTPPCEVLDPA